VIDTLFSQPFYWKNIWVSPLYVKLMWISPNKISSVGKRVSVKKVLEKECF
jgi:hypothetical protein